ncbi:MAG: polyketide cyclase [Acidimicrobiaceae bacterium]|nr:polyketide cyclase [Acidimicrobiaceae bacterium]
MSEHTVTHATFTLERRYPPPPERVFAAWSDEATKRRWFAKDAPGYRLDFRVGGVERHENTHDGLAITWESLYRDLVENRRIAYTSVLLMGDRLATMSQTTVEMTDVDGHTRLVLTEQGAFLDGHELPAWREEGTAAWLDPLGALLLRGDQ